MKNLEHQSLTLDQFEISVKSSRQLRRELIPVVNEMTHSDPLPPIRDGAPPGGRLETAGDVPLYLPLASWRLFALIFSCDSPIQNCTGGSMFMSFIFEKLEVYQRAVDFAERIETLSKGIAGQGYYHLLEQLRRASLSIPLNIAEGNGRWHPRDRKNFFWIARGSAFECVPLVELCRRQVLISDDICLELKAELEALSKMLTALVKGSDRGRQRESSPRG